LQCRAGAQNITYKEENPETDPSLIFHKFFFFCLISNPARRVQLRTVCLTKTAVGHIWLAKRWPFCCYSLWGSEVKMATWVKVQTHLFRGDVWRTAEGWVLNFLLYILLDTRVFKSSRTWTRALRVGRTTQIKLLASLQFTRPKSVHATTMENDRCKRA
jgi:hypothetical protein